MKRILTIILITVLTALSLAACGGKDGAPGATTVPAETGAQTGAGARTEAATAADPAPTGTESGREPLKTDGLTAEPQPETETDAPTAPDTVASVGTTLRTEDQTEPVVEFDPRAAAIQCIGESVDVLYARIGYPNDSLYAPSCMGDGDDGELYYSWFTVVTYREGGIETVVDVY